MTNSKTNDLPYDMGNAGDLLKHGVLAEFVCWRSSLGASVRFLDLFGGNPYDDNVTDKIVRRVDTLEGSALHKAQPYIGEKRYYGSGGLVLNLARRIDGSRVAVFAADRDPKKREKLQDAGMSMLEEAFPSGESTSNYDAYSAFGKIAPQTTEGDLALIDPFNDFLKPDRNQSNRAIDIIPQMAKMAENASVILFALNLNPFNPVGRRFDELLEEHLNGGLIMTCPPLRGTGVRGECNYFADVVLASQTLSGDRDKAAALKSRFVDFAKRLAESLGLSERGAQMLRPRTIGDTD